MIIKLFVSDMVVLLSVAVGISAISFVAVVLITRFVMGTMI